MVYYSFMEWFLSLPFIHYYYRLLYIIIKYYSYFFMLIYCLYGILHQWHHPSCLYLMTVIYLGYILLFIDLC